MHAEPGHDLVEDEEGAVGSGQLSQAREEPFDRQDEAHVPCDGLDDYGGDLTGVLGEQPLDDGEVVVRRDERVDDGSFRHAW